MIPNPDKPEITNYKHQNTISKSQIGSKANFLGFCISVIVICLVFLICYLKFFITETRHLKTSFSNNMLSEKAR